MIRAGLRALQERDSAVEQWLRDEVVPVAMATLADPQRVIPVSDAFDEVRALHASRKKEVGGAG